MREAEFRILPSSGPYAVLRVGEQRARLRALKGARPNPRWHETFEFDISRENELEIMCACCRMPC